MPANRPGRSFIARTTAALLLGVAALLIWSKYPEAPRQAGPLSHEIYIWQRMWHDPVTRAVANHASHFAELHALAAEVSWERAGPEIVEVALDYSSLRSTGKPVGLVLRLGPYSGPFPETTGTWLAGLAASLVQTARSNQLNVAELQIDFDCPESKLDGFRGWLDLIGPALGDTPLTITALPAWLDRRGWARLLQATDGYVLQVHSLTRPGSISDRSVLCDPAAARSAVERASRLPHPFRVALPTYGYLLAFSPDDRFVGVSAEGPSLAWPTETRLREVRVDPQEMAGLVASWTGDRPANMTGIIWYRLPIEGESLNWSWPTLRTVMDARAPRSDLRINLLQPKPGLVEIQLANLGDGAHDQPVQVTLSWQAGRVVATEALAGFELVGGGNLCWRTGERGWVLGPDQVQLIGWARFENAVGLEAKLASE